MKDYLSQKGETSSRISMLHLFFLSSIWYALAFFGQEEEDMLSFIYNSFEHHRPVQRPRSFIFARQFLLTGQLCFVIFYNNVFTRLDVRCTWKRFSGAHTRVAGSRRGPDMVTADHSSRTLICDGASVNCGHRKVHGTIFEIC